MIFVVALQFPQRGHGDGGDYASRGRIRVSRIVDLVSWGDLCTSANLSAALPLKLISFRRLSNLVNFTEQVGELARKVVSRKHLPKLGCISILRTDAYCLVVWYEKYEEI